MGKMYFKNREVQLKKRNIQLSRTPVDVVRMMKVRDNGRKNSERKTGNTKGKRLNLPMAVMRTQ